jgi:hypothetical protein
MVCWVLISVVFQGSFQNSVEYVEISFTLRQWFGTSVVALGISLLGWSGSFLGSLYRQIGTVHHWDFWRSALWTHSLVIVKLSSLIVTLFIIHHWDFWRRALPTRSLVIVDTSGGEGSTHSLSWCHCVWEISLGKLMSSSSDTHTHGCEALKYLFNYCSSQFLVISCVPPSRSYFRIVNRAE